MVTNRSGNGTTLWDRIDGGYVPDAAIDTGTNEPVAPAC